MPRSARVIVVGGGIAGLATGLNLKDRAASVPGGLEIQVLEAGARAGGRVQTEHWNGFTIEQGPTGFLDDAPPTAALVERLGLTTELCRADGAASTRFLFYNGCLHAIPSGPVAFLRSPILSRRARLRVLLEPFVPRGSQGADETVHEFASRRVGAEAAEVLADAMVSGLFAGSARELSLASTFPALAALEAEHGSLVRGLIARRRKARTENRERGYSRNGLGPGGRLSSFRQGLGTLIHRLATALEGAVLCDQQVVSVEPVARANAVAPAHGAFRWRVTTAAGTRLEADAVVVAVASRDASSLLINADRVLAQTVGMMPTAAVVVVALGFETRALGGLPSGFGFLVPRNQGLRTLGCVWDSSVFPGRTPGGTMLLRCILGGAHDANAMQADDESLGWIARRDLETAMGITASPILARVYRHPLGIAQYVCGHRDRLNLVEQRLRELPGLWVAGSSYYGVSINACVDKARRQADEILAFLGAPSTR